MPPHFQGNLSYTSIQKSLRVRYKVAGCWLKRRWWWWWIHFLAPGKPTVIVVVVVGGCGGSGSAAVRNKEPKIILKKGNNHKEDAGCHGTTRTDGVVRAASSVTFNALSFCHPRPNNENVFEQTARFTMARHDVISNAAETPCTTTNTKAASHTLPGNGNELDRGFKTCDCVSKQFLGRGGDWLKTWGRCVVATWMRKTCVFFLFCAKPD